MRGEHAADVGQGSGSWSVHSLYGPANPSPVHTILTAAPAAQPCLRAALKATVWYRSLEMGACRAGVVKCWSPGSRITLRNLSRSRGVVLETCLLRHHIRGPVVIQSAVQSKEIPVYLPGKG
ncbi:hypothetical protein RRG08_047396 [Elysia crispata]|uniref:Uncharacterized protein n=1 Tax=Elysia crispata TaxID=231223 RepID=A0AAE0YUC6_9GAST|nr:hypothetical protein RRG08_047396 [Elysia crispata]